MNFVSPVYDARSSSMKSHEEATAAVNADSQKEVIDLTRTYNNQEQENIFPCEGELLLYIPHHRTNY